VRGREPPREGQARQRAASSKAAVHYVEKKASLKTGSDLEIRAKPSERRLATMQLRHIFVGIDLGDKSSVARIGVDREKGERFGFVNSRQGRARLLREVKNRAEQLGEAKIVMAYEASSCGFVLSDEAE
jgi:hypothetical protein